MVFRFKKGTTIAVSVLLAGSLLGCAPEANQGGEPAGQENIEQGTDQNNGQVSEGHNGTNDHANDDNVNGPSERAETKEETIQIEGMEETFTFRLYEDEGLQLSTYIIEGMAVDSESSADGDAITVYYDRDGERDPNATILIYSPSSGTQDSFVSEQDIVRWVENQGYAVNNVSEEKVEVAYTPGVRYIFNFTKDGQPFNGNVIRFEHNNRVYLIFTSYLPEYGDGMAARVTKLLEEMEWLK